MYETLTWPQVYLLLDGSGYNAPLPYESEDKEQNPDIPPEPDRKSQPVDYLRWQFTHAPGVPAHIRKSTEEVDAMCIRFATEIECGDKVWCEDVKDWVINPEIKPD